MKEGSDYSSESDFGEENYQNAEERVFIDRRYDIFNMDDLLDNEKENEKKDEKFNEFFLDYS